MFNIYVKKLSKSLFFLQRAKNFVCTKSLKLLYFALLHSNLLYCIGTLSAMNNTNAKKILVMQKKAIRTISNAKYNDHTAPLFLKHQILPYNLMQKQFILSFMHGVEYGYGQESFIANWPENAQRGRAYECPRL